MKVKREFRLWQLLLAIALVALVLALLPERIGVPIFLLIMGGSIIALVVIVGVFLFQKITRK